MKALIIDDEKYICSTIKNIIEDEGFIANVAFSFNEGFCMLKEDLYNIVFLDVWLPDIDGVKGIKKIKEYFPEIEIVMISGHGNIENAVESIKYGAYDFLEKPLSLDRILLIIRHLDDKIKLQHEISEYRYNVMKKYELIGASDKLDELKKNIEKVAPTNAWVLISGENGTGKEHVARLIHILSKRSFQKFVEINCSAIPGELIESEMFGYEKGAFTGAANKKIGKFELADKGTLFMDEIGDMDISLQSKLLRVLEIGEFMRLGSNELVKSNFRLISATNKNLENEILQNRFREDLYYRINVVPIGVPALRERVDDIPYLIDHFVKEICYSNGFELKKVDGKVTDFFIKYNWPGNVRQLKHCIERMIVLAEGTTISLDMAKNAILGVKKVAITNFDSINMVTFKEAREEYEKKYLLFILKNVNWNITKAAKILDIERTYLHKKIKDYSLDAYK